MTLVKAGKLFFLSSGYYSDYSIQGHFLALEDITTELFQSVVDELKAEIDSGTLRRSHDRAGVELSISNKNSILDDYFLPRLVKRGVILEIDVEEIEIGGYGELEIEGVKTYE
jgi:hypothetical protein